MATRFRKVSRSCFNLAQRPRTPFRTGEENEGLGNRRHGVSTPHPDSSQSPAYVAKKSFIVIERNWTGTLWPRFELWLQVLLADRSATRENWTCFYSCASLIACSLPYSPMIFGSGTSKESFRLTSKRVTYSLRLG